MPEGRIWNGSSWLPITDEGHRNASDPHPQYLLVADQQLEEDEFTESTAITSYPEGISIMAVSNTADWAESATKGTVTTHRTGT